MGRILLLLLVLVALGADLRLVRKGLKDWPYPAGQDGKTPFFRRLAPLAPALADREEVGYQIAPQAKKRWERSALRMAQFALAPVIVRPDEKADLVIGDGCSPEGDGWVRIPVAGTDLGLFRQSDAPPEAPTRAAAAAPPPFASGQPSPAGLLAGLLAPALAAFALIRRLAPSLSWPAACGLSLGLGQGLAACAFFLWRLAGGIDGPYAAAETAACLLLALALRPTAAAPSAPAAPERVGQARLAAFLLVLSVAAAAFILLSLTSPWGDWDALKTWNLKARFLVADDARWRNLVSPRIDEGLPDYPLLLPCTVARLWIFAGAQTPAGPIAAAGLFAAASVLLLSAGVAQACGRRAGLLAGIALAGTSQFVKEAHCQFADVPVGFFFLASFLLALHARRGAPGALLLAGLSAGLAAWTKNEGIQFCGLFALAWVILAPDRRAGWRLLAGAAAPLVIVAVFKLWLAPDNPVAALARDEPALEKILSPARYLWIARYYAEDIALLGYGILPLLTVRILVGRSPALPGARLGPAVIALMLAAYAVAYLLTPLPIAWHLDNSFDRLLVQLWPSALLAWFAAGGGDRPAYS